MAVSLERLMSFLLLPLYADAFTVSEFGVIDLIQTFCGIATIFAFLQLETALQRFYYEYDGVEKGKFIFSVFVMIMSAALLISIVIIIIAPKVSLLLCSSENFASSFRIAAVLIIFSVLSTLTLILLRFEKRNKCFMFVVLLKSFLLVGAVYWFVYVKGSGVDGFFVSQLIAISISALVSLFLMRKIFVPKLSKALIRQSLKYALPQFPARIGSATNAHANRFFIVGYLNTYSVGLFSMALKISSIFQLVHQTFMMAWNQYMFQLITKPDCKRYFIAINRVIVPVVCFLSLCLFLFSEELIINFASPKYADSAKYVGGIVLSFALMTIKETVDIGPKYKNKTYYLSVSFLSSLAVNLLSLSFLVGLCGVDGVVYSMLLTNMVLLMLSWKFSYKLFPIKFSYIWLVASILPVLLLAIIMMYVTVPLTHRLSLLAGLTVYYLFLIYKSVIKYKKLTCRI